ncbi:MAG: hypothetical protein K0R17_2148 [Rariglobus sp.]|jgi:uncharacterized protein YcfL|nr:hypothetical protein [Rariglobus sp.]
MKKTLLSLAGLAALALLTGCSHGPYAAKDTTKYTLENTEKFVLMDKQVQHSVTSTGIQQRVNDDGRLEVVANIKNRENRRIQVQVSCVFKDAQGFSTGDETPWQNLILGENTTEAVNFKSMNTQARTYTIRVRQAR